MVCEQLSSDDLFAVLKSSEGSIVRQYEQSFEAYDIEVLFRDEGLRRIATLADAEKTGARGLMTVMERAFRDLKFELPSSHVRRFEVTADLIDHPDAALKILLAEQARQERLILRDVIVEFGERFTESYGLKLRFTVEASDYLVESALNQNKAVRELCAEKFKDFQFGLRLISTNTGQAEFIVDRVVVENPDKLLSEWVVASYRENHPVAQGPQSMQVSPLKSRQPGVES